MPRLAWSAARVPRLAPLRSACSWDSDVEQGDAQASLICEIATIGLIVRVKRDKNSPIGASGSNKREIRLKTGRIAPTRHKFNRLIHSLLFHFNLLYQIGFGILLLLW